MAREKPETYVVQPGDTLSMVARRPEIYGDAAMWMMLYRTNASRIASADWLCPGQVLTVPRQFSAEDAKLAREQARHRAPWPPGAKATPVNSCKGGAAAPAAVESTDSSVRQEAVNAGTAATSRVTATSATPGAAAGPPAVRSRSEGAAVAAIAAVVAESGTAAPATPAPVTLGLARDAYRDAARRAYSLGDLQWASYYYQQHLAQDPQDDDALGELGNIHYRSGDLPRAASLYYGAALRLIERGNRARATQLIPLVSEGNPALARDLYLRLTAPPLR